MRLKKTISMVLALMVLLLSLLVFQMFQKTQLVMFESISFNMPLESFEKVFGKPNEIAEETETGYHNPWRAKDPYLYKTKLGAFSMTTKTLNGKVIVVA